METNTNFYEVSPNQLNLLSQWKEDAVFWNKVAPSFRTTVNSIITSKHYIKDDKATLMYLRLKWIKYIKGEEFSLR